MSTNWKDISRVDWCTSTQKDTEDTREKTKLGSMQRIADAVEKMAINHTELIDERDGLKNRVENYKNSCDYKDRQIAALKGVITKLKKGRAK